MSKWRRLERDLRRLLMVVAAQSGARLVELRTTGGSHIRASFDRGGPLFTSSTPGDVRTIKNFKARAKRVLR
jgi:hypothetical protein